MSLRKAINDMCRSCSYDPAPGNGNGTWRQQVDACASPKCPLFPVRPKSAVRGRGEDEKSILVRENGQIGAICAAGG
jgi:hypothetical protein